MLLFHLGGSVYYPITELSYVIDWGDGTTQSFAVESGIMIDIPYSWMNPGVYTLSLSVIDPFTGDAVVTFYDVSIQEEPTGCPFTLVLYDSYGDGWNGGFLDVFVNAVPVLTGVTLESGPGPADFIFFAETGDLVECVYTAGGWPHENSYTVSDSTGDIVFADGQDETIPLGGSFVALCPGGFTPPTPPIIEWDGTAMIFVGIETEFGVGGSEYQGPGLLTYTIDWDDDSLSFLPLAAGEFDIISHAWSQPGDYQITVVAQSDDGQTSPPTYQNVFVLPPIFTNNIHALFLRSTPP
jgi:hypothetical protein